MLAFGYKFEVDGMVLIHVVGGFVGEGQQQREVVAVVDNRAARVGGLANFNVLNGGYTAQGF